MVTHSFVAVACNQSHATGLILVGLIREGENAWDSNVRTVKPHQIGKAIFVSYVTIATETSPEINNSVPRMHLPIENANIQFI